MEDGLGGYMVGVLVQTNFGGVLQIDGVPIGQELGKYYHQLAVRSSNYQRQEWPYGGGYSIGEGVGIMRKYNRTRD